jgi:uracil-DNA glycosylase
MTFTPEAPKDCILCPRLVEYRNINTRENPDWFNGPAPSFGDDNAWLLVAGLAPGRTGANRTGRPFTGDYAGDLLYQTLSKFKLMIGKYNASPDDGIILNGTMITNAVRCAPPENKPTTQEIAICNNFLKARIESLKKLTTIICLGKISHDATLRAIGVKPSQYKFSHCAINQIGKFRIIDSYHCSRYNTQTGRLTQQMFEKVFEIAMESTSPIDNDI